MKDGIERMVNGLAEERLDVFASLRETEPSGAKPRSGHHLTGLTERLLLPGHFYTQFTP